MDAGSYVRDPSKKIQLVHFLGEHRSPAIAALIVPYLEDVDEGVRFNAVEALLFQLSGKGDDSAESAGLRDAVLPPLVQLLGNKSEESRRIKVRMVEGLAEVGLPLGELAGQVEKAISELDIDARIDREKRVKLGSAK